MRDTVPVTQAGSEDPAKFFVECRFDDWAGGAKTALVVSNSAHDVRGGCRATNLPFYVWSSYGFGEETGYIESWEKRRGAR